MMYIYLTGIALIDDVETAWSFFHDSFLEILNKHAPMQKFRIKGRDNPWFTAELSCLLHERNMTWAKARKSDSEADWLLFRQLSKNKCISLFRKAKLSFI